MKSFPPPRRSPKNVLKKNDEVARALRTDSAMRAVRGQPGLEPWSRQDDAAGADADPAR